MEMVVEVEAERMEAARRRAARKIAEKTKIPGFRPGKAPYDVVRRYYGDAAITEEAVEVLVDEVYPLALKEADIAAGAMGSLENVESLEPPKFKFVVPLAPKVDLGKYQSVRLPYDWKEPGKDKLEAALLDMRRMYASTDTVERAVQVDDFVLIDLVGRKAKAAEGEAPLVERNGFAILVREDETDKEYPFPGFSQKLVGVKPGASKKVSHKYAKDYADDESLAGQTVEFEATVRTVRGVTLPELDDEFAKKTGMGETVAELTERLRENVNAESRNEYDDQYYTDLIEKIKAQATILYPEAVLAHEAEHVVEDIKRRLSSQGLDFETYLKMRNSTAEKFMEEEARPVAQKRLERGLIMDEIAKAEALELDEESLEKEFQQTWASLAMYDQEFSKATKGGTKANKQLVDAVAMDAANRLMTRRVLERMKELASGEAKPAKKAKKAEAEPAPEPAAKKAPKAKAAAKGEEEKPARKKSSKKAE